VYLTADAQRRVDRFDCSRRFRIEPKILFLSAGPETTEVRLVPHLEVPAAQFVFAVTFAPVPNQRVDEAVPFLVVRGWRDVGPIEKDRLIAARESTRHEAELDHRPQANLQERVIDAVHQLPVVNDLPLAVTTHRLHLIGEDAMAAQVTEPALTDGAAKLLLKVGAQDRPGVAAAHR